MMKTFYKMLVFVVIAALAAGCAPKAGESGEPQKEKVKLSISGAFALYPLVVTWAEKYQELHKEVLIDVSGGGAGKGMSDTLAGAVDMGMVSRELAPEELDKGAYGVAVTRDAVFCTISAKNPYLADLQKTGISKETLAGIFLTGEITTWGQVLGKPEITDEIHAFTRSDAAGAAEMWVKFVGGNKQDELLGIGVNADPGILEAVIKDPLGIGYNNLGYAYDLKTGAPIAGAMVLPLDINGNKQVDPDEEIATQPQAVNAVATGKYPSPPARPLYLVTKGKPTGATLDFLTWILNDGQSYVAEAGYVQLTADQLTESQGRLK